MHDHRDRFLLVTDSKEYSFYLRGQAGCPEERNQLANVFTVYYLCSTLCSDTLKGKMKKGGRSHVYHSRNSWVSCQAFMIKLGHEFVYFAKSYSFNDSNS